VDIANASRAMKSEEKQQAEANGITPVEFTVARDAIAVIVNPENPVRQLTLQQISDIYSGKFNNWSEIGGDDRTHVYFLETVLRLGDKTNPTLFSTDTLLLPSSEGIINEVRQNPNAIGYDGLGYVPPDLMNSVIAVARDASGPYVIPSIATVNDNSYPVARDLYIYTAGEPAGAIKDYINWILSPEAQVIVADLGFVPIK
ncbi:MAG: PstS family phosphate ABC transporter substrate-binding protein, partial [Chloroflexi bacterium]|nr:PstS family phosphate ABC transporter substrate-binding protein [Chloroflexota bacterium]